MIEVKNLHKGFADVQVLKGISTTFHPGKTSLIIGQSGSGKTVFLKTLIGLHAPEEGTISFDGRINTEFTIEGKRQWRQEIGMVFQGSALFDSQTVEENVMFPLKMFTDNSNSEMLDRVNFALNRVNLENSNLKLPAELSGGMQKRVAIARAIVMNPKYLFCDEPNSGLDPKTAIVIDNLIRELTYEYEMTTVVITHDMNSVIEIGDKILFIHNGENWWEGDRKSIITTENKEIVDFVYASDFMKEIRTSMQAKRV